MLFVEMSSSSEHFLKKSPTDLARRIFVRIEKLAVEPFPTDVKRVVNCKEKVFRVRVGDYRIQYSVFNESNTLFVSDINKRKHAYD